VRKLNRDLISRSAFKEFISSYGCLDAAVLLDDFPIAYDADKVVEQLEKCKRIMESPARRDCYNEECRVSDCTVCAFDKAIEIVKAGGVNA